MPNNKHNNQHMPLVFWLQNVSKINCTVDAVNEISFWNKTFSGISYSNISGCQLRENNIFVKKMLPSNFILHHNNKQTSQNHPLLPWHTVFHLTPQEKNGTHIERGLWQALEVVLLHPVRVHPGQAAHRAAHQRALLVAGHLAPVLRPADADGRLIRTADLQLLVLTGVVAEGEEGGREDTCKYREREGV